MSQICSRSPSLRTIGVISFVLSAFRFFLIFVEASPFAFLFSVTICSVSVFSYSLFCLSPLGGSWWPSSCCSYFSDSCLSLSFSFPLASPCCEVPSFVALSSTFAYAFDIVIYSTSHGCNSARRSSSVTRYGRRCHFFFASLRVCIYTLWKPTLNFATTLYYSYGLRDRRGWWFTNIFKSMWYNTKKSCSPLLTMVGWYTTKRHTAYVHKHLKLSERTMNLSVLSMPTLL